MGEQSDGAAGWGKKALLGVLVIVVLALVAYGVRMLAGEKSGKVKVAPKITLLTPPPPPPPPPPKFEKKIEPPKEQKEMKIDRPVDKAPTPPAPSPELKMDGPTGDGPSAFGAGKITSDDLSKVGNGKGPAVEATGMFNPFNNYASLIKGELQRFLGKNTNLRKRRYRIEVRVWVGDGGLLKRSELVGSTGDTDTDEAIRVAMATLPAFSEAMPANMPQPIRLRVVTGG